MPGGPGGHPQPAGNFGIPVVKAAPVVNNPPTGFTPPSSYGSVTKTTFSTSTNNVAVQTVNAPVLQSPKDEKSGNAWINIPFIDSKGHVNYNVSFPLWITSFSTGSYVQYENVQVHRGMSWFPIRRSEMSIQFTVAWPLQSQYSNSYNGDSGFIKMQKFQDLIRQHQQQSVLLNCPPLTFVYYNNTGTADNNHSPVIESNGPNSFNDPNLLKQVANLQNNVNPDYNFNTGTFNQPPDITKPLKSLNYMGWIDTIEKEYSRYKSVFTRSYRMNIINLSTDQVSSVNTQAATNSLVPNVTSPSKFGLGWSSANTTRTGGLNINAIQGMPN